MSQKSVLILSQEPWNFLFLSKQNYAVAFAEKGYKVFYCSFPTARMGWSFELSKVPNYPNIQLIQYSLPIPYFFRFRVKAVYRWVNKLFIKHYFIKKYKPLTLCIDFGLYHYLYKNMLWTGAHKNIFFPADNSNLLPNEYKGADAIFSVSDLILKKYKNKSTPTYLINHGLASPFAIKAQKNLTELAAIRKPQNSETKTIGYIGNLNFHLLDKELLLKIVKSIPEVTFRFFGKFEREIDVLFYDTLMSYKNVEYHGQKNIEELSTAMQSIDAFLMCYTKECNEEISGNSHKIMEYLSTGKVLFTTYIEMFVDKGFVTMSAKDKRDDFVAIIKEGMQQLEMLNSVDKQQQRLQFALNNTYAKHIETIEKTIVI